MTLKDEAAIEEILSESNALENRNHIGLAVRLGQLIKDVRMEAIPKPSSEISFESGHDRQDIKVIVDSYLKPLKPLDINTKSDLVFELENYVRVIRETQSIPTVEAALELLTQAFRKDPDFAHGWHCNIAMACFDSIGPSGVEQNDAVRHKIANKAASRFMKMAFNVETCKDSKYEKSDKPEQSDKSNGPERFNELSKSIEDFSYEDLLRFAKNCNANNEFQRGVIDGYKHEKETSLSPSEAIAAFVSWLTTCDSVTEMGSSKECASAFDRVVEFCKTNNLKDPRENYTDLFEIPFEVTPDKKAVEESDQKDVLDNFSHADLLKFAKDSHANNEYQQNVIDANSKLRDFYDSKNIFAVKIKLWPSEAIVAFVDWTTANVDKGYDIKSKDNLALYIKTFCATNGLTPPRPHFVKTNKINMEDGACSGGAIETNV